MQDHAVLEVWSSPRKPAGPNKKYQWMLQGLTKKLRRELSLRKMLTPSWYWDA